MEQRERRTSPAEQTDVHTALCRCGEEIAQSLCPVASKTEVRREVPAREPNRHARRLDCAGDLRQGLGAVDEHLEAVSRTWRWAGSPAAGRSRERAGVAEARQPTAMVRGDRLFDAVAYDRVELA